MSAHQYFYDDEDADSDMDFIALTRAIARQDCSTAKVSANTNDPQKLLQTSRDLLADIMMGILTDWTSIASGSNGHWSGTFSHELRQQLDELGVPKPENALIQPPSLQSASGVDRRASNMLAQTPDIPLRSRRSLFPRQGSVDKATQTALRNKHTDSEDRHDKLMGSPKKKRCVIRQSSDSDTLGEKFIATKIPILTKGRQGRYYAGLEEIPSQSLRALADDESLFDSYNGPILDSFNDPSISSARQRASPSFGPNLNLVFISQAIPRTMDASKRLQIMDLFHHKAPYIPTCIVSCPGYMPKESFGNLKHYRGALNQYGYALIAGTVSNLRKAKHSFPTVLKAPREEPSWPLSTPVEVYDYITEYLTRDDVKQMRLTCKSFARMVSAKFFSHVVLPFTPMVYGIDNSTQGQKLRPFAKGDSEDSIARRSGVSYMLDMRSTTGATATKMFKDWGHSVTKFGICFEVNEDSLKAPPEKMTEKNTRTFWGIYRWPIDHYVRFANFQKLEWIADQSITMRKAFENFTNVTALGLSLNNSYGWLNGPDQSDHAILNRAPAKIFGSQFNERDVKERRRQTLNNKRSVESGRFNLNLLKQYARILNLSNLATVGHLDIIANFMKDSRLNHLPNSERHEMERRLEIVLRSVLQPTASRTSGSRHSILDDIPGSAPRIPISQLFYRAKRERDQVTPPANSSNTSIFWNTVAGRLEYRALFVRDLGTEPDENDPWDPIRNQSLARENVVSTDENALSPRLFNLINLGDPVQVCEKINMSKFELSPKNLSNAQKEWLIENEWAQRAFINSFNLAIMDTPGIMNNIMTFNIGNLSSLFLPELNRGDVWLALPNIKDVTIIVSPDWRRIIRQDEHSFADLHAMPSQASEEFNGLLRKRIAPKESIKNLRIGFLGGGEHATGLYARNRNILPSPISSRNHGIVEFPYLRSLSFTNCWFTSDTLCKFMEQMRFLKIQNLENVKLDSVSLLAFGGLTAAPRDHTIAILNNLAVRGLSGSHLPFGLTMPSSINGNDMQTRIIPGLTTGYSGLSGGECLRTAPTSDSWFHVIDSITPGHKIAEIRSARGVGPEVEEKIEDLFLHCLEFVSCGYVQLRYQHLYPGFEAYDPPTQMPQVPQIGVNALGQRAIIPPVAPANVSTSPAVNAKKLEIKDFMLHSRDIFLGQIIPYIPHPEKTILELGYDMTIGWDDNVKYDNLEDGQLEGGSGRFSGVINRVTRQREVDPWKRPIIDVSIP